MPRYWLKPHRYGYGATPTTWQGWVSSLIFVLATVGGTVFLASMLKGSPWKAWGGPIIVVFAFALTLLFIGFSRRKTDGDWRWRWGRDSQP
jgi:divalent metal cation (Fe/Co/Zn/Cd) transporter